MIGVWFVFVLLWVCMGLLMWSDWGTDNVSHSVRDFWVVTIWLVIATGVMVGGL